MSEVINVPNDEGTIYQRYNYWINNSCDREGVQASSFKEASKKAKDKVKNIIKEGDILTVKWTMGDYSEQHVVKFQRYQRKWKEIPFSFK